MHSRNIMSFRVLLLHLAVRVDFHDARHARAPPRLLRPLITSIAIGHRGLIAHVGDDTRAEERRVDGHLPLVASLEV